MSLALNQALQIAIGWFIIGFFSGVLVTTRFASKKYK